jgi:hypothetical protein
MSNFKKPRYKILSIVNAPCEFKIGDTLEVGTEIQIGSDDPPFILPWKGKVTANAYGTHPEGFHNDLSLEEIFD